MCVCAVFPTAAETNDVPSKQNALLPGEGLPNQCIGKIISHAMRIAHCQFEPWCGDFEHNLARFAEEIGRAHV